MNETESQSKEVEKKPELSAWPFFELLRRLIEEAEWTKSEENKILDELKIEDLIYEKTEDVLERLESVKKCAMVIQALIEFKLETFPRNKKSSS